MVPQQCFSSEERDSQHVRSLHQQLVFGFLKVLSPQATICLKAAQGKNKSKIFLNKIGYKVTTLKAG